MQPVWENRNSCPISYLHFSIHHYFLPRSPGAKYHKCPDMSEYSCCQDHLHTVEVTYVWLTYLMMMMITSILYFSSFFYGSSCACNFWCALLCSDVFVEESPASCQILHLLEEGGPRPLTFILNANLLVNVKLVTCE